MLAKCEHWEYNFHVTNSYTSKKYVWGHFLNILIFHCKLKYSEAAEQLHKDNMQCCFGPVTHSSEQQVVLLSMHFSLRRDHAGTSPVLLLVNVWCTGQSPGDGGGNEGKSGSFVFFLHMKQWSHLLELLKKKHMLHLLTFFMHCPPANKPVVNRQWISTST